VAKKSGSRTRRLADLGPREQLARSRALEALARMRRERVSLAQAARDSQTSVKTVTKYVASGLRKIKNGQYRAKPSDRLLRSLRFLTPEGLIAVDVRGSRKASSIARFWTAVDRYLTTGLADGLTAFRGKSITIGKLRYPFITDPRTLERLGSAGEVRFEDLYAAVR
jgi:hypothetical protein